MNSPCAKSGNEDESQFAANSEASEDGAQQMEHNSPMPRECSQDLEHSCTPNRPNTTSKSPLVTTLDDLTPTQVLFGHGSYGGITVSQPPSCPSTHVASPSANANSHEASGGQADHDTDIEAVMGLCNLSQNPTFQLPTSPKVLQHQDMVVGDFAGSVYSPTKPHCILGSQDVPDVLNNRTPFLDLMFAQTQPSSQCSKILRSLAKIDSRILSEGEHFNDERSGSSEALSLATRMYLAKMSQFGSQCALTMEKLDSIMEAVETYQ
ncbi:unnamed protein product [Calypogeia fissa]